MCRIYKIKKTTQDEVCVLIGIGTSKYHFVIAPKGDVQPSILGSEDINEWKGSTAIIFDEFEFTDLFVSYDFYLVSETGTQTARAGSI